MSVAATRQRPATDITSWRLAMRLKSTPEERLWAQVEKTETCWLWTGATSNKGYGQTSIPGHFVAHRFAYELLVGPIPEGLTLDHLCRVRNCVNPEHLDPVTNRENVLRGEGITAQNARKTHCLRGHEFQQVRQAGKRICLECKRIQQRPYTEKRNAAAAARRIPRTVCKNGHTYEGQTGPCRGCYMDARQRWTDKRRALNNAKKLRHD